MHETMLLATAAMLAMAGLAATQIEQRVYAKLFARPARPLRRESSNK